MVLSEGPEAVEPLPHTCADQGMVGPTWAQDQILPSCSCIDWTCFTALNLFPHPANGHNHALLFRLEWKWKRTRVKHPSMIRPKGIAVIVFLVFIYCIVHSTISTYFIIFFAGFCQETLALPCGIRCWLSLLPLSPFVVSAWSYGCFPLPHPISHLVKAYQTLIFSKLAGTHRPIGHDRYRAKAQSQGIITF